MGQVTGILRGHPNDVYVGDLADRFRVHMAELIVAHHHGITTRDDHFADFVVLARCTRGLRSSKRSGHLTLDAPHDSPARAEAAVDGASVRRQKEDSIWVPMN